MTSLSQHSPKNKAARQLDLFANEVPTERTDNAAPVFRDMGDVTEKPVAAATLADPLAGLVVKLEHDFCRCGSNVAIIGDGKAMHRASLNCRSCGCFRGWLSKFTANWIEAVVNLHGRPDTPIIVRGPRP